MIQLPKFKSEINTFLIFAFLLVQVIESQGQKQGPWFKNKDKFIESCCHVEIHGGTVYSNMKYSNFDVNSIERDNLFLYDFGASWRYQKIKPFSYSIRFSYLGQGVTLKSDPAYKLKANYISLSFPIEIQFNIIYAKRGSDPKSYFYIAPYIATPVSGSAEAGFIKEKLNIGKDINSLNYGAEAGFGFRIPTFSLEDRSNLIVRVSYMQGLNDTFCPIQNKVFNDNLYVVDGTRINSGIKLTLCLEFPLNPKSVVSFTAGGDGKKNYKKVVNIGDR